MGFKVGDNYRTNPLSNTPGGVNICVKQDNGKIFEYDKVKDPWAYIYEIKKYKPTINVWWKKDTPENKHTIK